MSESTERHLEECSTSTNQDQAESQIDNDIHTDDRQQLADGSRNYMEIACCRIIASDKLLFGIGALPITFAILIVSALVINYLIAVHLDHVSPIWPYVSWLASYGPEEYIFDFLLSLASINVAFIIYFKYKAIASLHSGLILIITWNKVCAWIGLITSFFFLMSATFPAVDEKSINKVHGIVSKAGFSCLCVYFFVETIMSFYIRSIALGLTKCICIARAVLTFLCCACLITAYVTAKIASTKLPKPENPKHWKPTDGGYVCHLVSSFCEWGIVLTMVAYFLTYIAELKHLKTKIIITEKTEIHTECHQEVERTT